MKNAILAIIMLTALGGWIANIVKIIGTLAEPITAFFIARIAGIFFFPLGCVLGFF